MPQSFQAFILILLFIAPGFVFMVAYRSDIRKNKYVQPSLFEQTVSSLIASAAIHTLLMPLLGGCTIIFLKISKSSFFVKDFLKPIPDYSVLTLWIYFTVSAIYCVVSLLFGWYGGRLLQRIQKLESPLWWKLIGEAFLKDKPHSWFKVLLRNGDEFTGVIESIRYIGGEESIYEVILKNAFCSKRIGESEVQSSGASGSGTSDNRLYLISKDILWIMRIDTQPQTRSE